MSKRSAKQPTIKDLIALRTSLRRHLHNTKIAHSKAVRVSFGNTDSDCYVISKRLSGEYTGLSLGIRLVDDLIKRVRGES